MLLPKVMYCILICISYGKCSNHDTQPPPVLGVCQSPALMCHVDAMILHHSIFPSLSTNPPVSWSCDCLIILSSTTLPER